MSADEETPLSTNREILAEMLATMQRIEALFTPLFLAAARSSTTPCQEHQPRFVRTPEGERNFCVVCNEPLQ